MKLSKALHVVSVAAGLIGVVMTAFAVLFWPEGDVLGLTRQIMLLCSIAILLVAIWTQIAAIHHMMLEKKGQVI